jgi:hypothetical protein
VERTFSRVHPTTGEKQERVVDNNADAVKLTWNGWAEVGENKPVKKAAKKAVAKKATGAPPARELNDNV